MEVKMTHPRKKPGIRNNAKLSIPNLHYGEMKEIARLNMRQIAAKYGLTQYTTKTGKRFWFKDNGAKVLFVAHQDTVQDPGVFQPVHFEDDTWIFSPTHDDRAGMYVGLCYLPKAKVKVDILITDDEEDGRSTALWFDPPKKYNWMFMFDRRGKGAVCYQYDNEALRYKLGKHNFKVDWGTYSCIRNLEHLGCQGINFGVGYHDNHSNKAYLSTTELRQQLRKFVDFFREYEYLNMPHDIGYKRFAQAVNYNSREFNNEERERYGLTPRIKGRKVALTEIFPAKDDFGDGEIINIAKEYDEHEYDHSQYTNYTDSKDIDLPDYGAYKKSKYDTKTLVTVDDKGKITGWKQERNYFKLYRPVEVLDIDSVTENILRNTFDCEYIYDVVQLSEYWLVSSGYIPAWDVDQLVKDIHKMGFTMRMNLQGLMSPKHYEKAYACGWKQREKVINLKRPVSPEELLEAKTIQSYEAGKLLSDEKLIVHHNVRLEAAKKPKPKVKEVKIAAEKKPPRSLRDIVLYPKPDADNYLETLNGARGLIGKGYNVEVHAICQTCKADEIVDITKVKRLPKVCSNCQTEFERTLSSFESDEVGISDLLEPSFRDKDDGEVLKSIPLIKDKDDDSEYVYTGKDGGRKGVDRYNWENPASYSPKEKVGFVTEPS